MAYDNQGGGGGFQRQMFKGDWKCASCNGDITELPFEPDPNRLNQLYCRNCHRERRSSFKGNDRGFGGGDR
jgi:CxxC-x17-CxxC domain-containing protein